MWLAFPGVRLRTVAHFEPMFEPMFELQQLLALGSGRIGKEAATLIRTQFLLALL